MDEEDELQLGPPLVVEDVVIRPIARRRIASLSGEAGRASLARLRPLGVLVEDGGEPRALDLEGNELPEDVLAELPDVGEG